MNTQTKVDRFENAMMKTERFETHSCNWGLSWRQVCYKNLIHFAVVRQQFVIGINCSIFLYGNWFGANQPLALTRKSFRIVQVSHCAVSSWRMFCSNGFDIMHIMCVQILLCVACIGLLYPAGFSAVNTGLCLETSVSVEYF